MPSKNNDCPICKIGYIPFNYLSLKGYFATCELHKKPIDAYYIKLKGVRKDG